MIIKYNFINLKRIYIFFLFLVLLNIFFPIANIYANILSVNNVEISKPFVINFNKNDIIDEGIKVAFNRLITPLIKSDDQNQISQLSIYQIKSMIESFSINQEKFINGIYYLNLSVEFNKKKIFSLLRNQNTNSYSSFKNKIFFMPIIIDENTEEIFIFEENMLFKKWNIVRNVNSVLEYILPEDNLENLRIIIENKDYIENYNFDQIIQKYNTDGYIISLIYVDGLNIKVVSKINFNKIFKVNTNRFQNVDLQNNDNIDKFISNLKIIYEDFWNIKNQFNNSSQSELNISINILDNEKISNIEKTLANLELVNDYYLTKIDNKYIYYKIFFNGDSNNFLKIMKNNNYEFYIQNQLLILK